MSKTLTTTEAIALLGFKSAAYLNQLLQSGQIEGTQDSGGRWQVSRASVLAFKANRKADKPKIVGAGFVESVSKGELERNRAALNEKLMGAKAAVLIDRHGVVKTIKRKR